MLKLYHRIYYTLRVSGDSSQDHLALIDQATQTELQVYFIISEKLPNQVYSSCLLNRFLFCHHLLVSLKHLTHDPSCLCRLFALLLSLVIPKYPFVFLWNPVSLPLRIQNLYRPSLGTTTAIGLFISVPRVCFRLAGIKGSISCTLEYLGVKPLGQWWQGTKTNK